jgi:hypothetical protein
MFFPFLKGQKIGLKESITRGGENPPKDSFPIFNPAVKNGGGNLFERA